MYVLAIDPGVETGIALLSENNIVWSVTSRAPFVEIDSALSTYVDVPVVCEQAPTVHKHEADTYDQVTGMLNASGADVTYITPSQWKGHPSSRLTATDRAQLSTKHEREAVSLGRRFIAMRRTDAQQDQARSDQPAGGHAAAT